MPQGREPLTTLVDAGFEIRPSRADRILVSGGLQSVARHMFSTRQLEFLADTQERDYARVAEHFQVTADRVLRIRQELHGRVVVTVRPGDHWSSVPEADAIVSLDPARVVSVRVADCVPVLLADRHHRAVASVHAGWRGTAAGVSEAVVDVLRELAVSPSGSLRPDWTVDRTLLLPGRRRGTGGIQRPGCREVVHR